MKISPEKSLQKKLQDKEYFLKETALITQTGSYSGNFKTGCCFMNIIEGRALYLPEYFKSVVTLFVQNKQILRLPAFTGNNSDLEEFVFKNYLTDASISFLHTLEHLNDVLRIYSSNREEVASSFTVKF